MFPGQSTPRQGAFGLRRIARELISAQQGVSEYYTSGGANPGNFRLRRRAMLEAAKDIQPFYQPGKISYLDSGTFSSVYSINDSHVLRLSTIEDSIPEVSEVLRPVSSRVAQYKQGLFSQRNKKVFGGNFPDLPILPSNSVGIQVVPKAEVWKGGFEDRGKWNQMAEDLRVSLEKKGYTWKDAAARNIGIIESKPVIIDYGFIERSAAANKRIMQAGASEAKVGTGLVSKLISGSRRMSGII